MPNRKRIPYAAGQLIDQTKMDLSAANHLVMGELKGRASNQLLQAALLIQSGINSQVELRSLIEREQTQKGKDQPEITIKYFPRRGWRPVLKTTTPPLARAAQSNR